jgi:hypothetical protein
VPAENIQEPRREPHPSGVDPNPSVSLAFCIFLDRASAEEAATPFLGTPGLEIEALLRMGMVEYSVLISHGTPEVEYLCTDGRFHAPALGIGSRVFRNPSSPGVGRPGE